VGRRRIALRNIQPVYGLVALVVLAMLGLVWIGLSSTEHGEAKEKTEEAIAFYTLWLMVFTGVLALSTIALWRSTKDAVNLGREEFISTHRPQIFVRNVFCPFAAADGAPIEVDFTIVNGGSTPARIAHSVFVVELFQVEGLMIFPVAIGGNDLNLIGARSILAPGESRVFRHVSPVVRWSAAANRDWENAREGLFFSGHIVYTDENDTSRHTAIRRRYDPQAQRFYPIDDKEHEYAD